MVSQHQVGEQKDQDLKAYTRPQLVKHGKVETLTQTFDWENGSCPIREPS